MYLLFQFLELRFHWFFPLSCRHPLTCLSWVLLHSLPPASIPLVKKQSLHLPLYSCSLCAPTLRHPPLWIWSIPLLPSLPHLLLLQPLPFLKLKTVLHNTETFIIIIFTFAIIHYHSHYHYLYY